MLRCTCSAYELPEVLPGMWACIMCIARELSGPVSFCNQGNANATNHHFGSDTLSSKHVTKQCRSHIRPATCYKSHVQYVCVYAHVQGCRPLSGETYSVEKAQEGVVFELATTGRFPKTLRPMEALSRDMKTQVCNHTQHGASPSPVNFAEGPSLQ